MTKIILAQVILKLYEHEFICDNKVTLAQVIMKLYIHELTCDNQVIDRETLRT